MSDDLVHAPGAERQWRESYYFSFFDPTRQIGGFTSIGKRPATGHSGFIIVIWGPHIPTLVASEYDTFGEWNNTHEIAGLTYTPLSPFGPWRLTFDGPLNNGGSDIECDHNALGPARGEATAHVQFDLTFHPSHPPYSYSDQPGMAQLFTGHIDEVGAMRGTLAIDDASYEIDAVAGKDHSWGIRNWFAPREWRWLDLVLVPGEHDHPDLTLWRGRFDDDPGEFSKDGALYLRDGSVVPVEEYTDEVTTSERALKPLPRTMRINASAAGTDLKVEGTILRVLPAVFVRADGDNQLVAWNDRALVDCALADGTRGWANVEIEALVRAPGGTFRGAS